MNDSELIDLHFDKGNGAIFSVCFDGKAVRCFVSQANAFLDKKASASQSFDAVFERYAKLIAEAAKLNISKHGVSSEPWGNLITETDIEIAQQNRGKKAI